MTRAADRATRRPWCRLRTASPLAESWVTSIAQELMHVLRETDSQLHAHRLAGEEEPQHARDIHSTSHQQLDQKLDIVMCIEELTHQEEHNDQRCAECERKRVRLAHE